MANQNNTNQTRSQLPLDQIPADLVSLADIEHYSTQHLSPGVSAYINGGVADEICLRRNRLQWQCYFIEQRVLADCSAGHTRLELLGQALDHPFVLAPVAHQQLAHPDGEVATAIAAAALGGGMIVSQEADCIYSDVVTATDHLCWLQLYLTSNEQTNLTKAEIAARTGFQALVVTLDAPVNGIRNRLHRSGFQVPVSTNRLSGNGLDERQRKTPEQLAPGSSLVFQQLMTAAPNWQTMAAFVKHCPLPVIAKGVSHPDDAQRLVDLGCQALIMSNHGGRVLDESVTPLHALTRIRKSLAPDIPLLVDGGIRRGADAFIALAAGATAVLVGRPQVHSLAVAGAAGVARMLRILRDELEVTMSLAGCPTLASINSTCIYQSAREQQLC
ncbi:MAG: alpha-hydroxy-acid oxidizing protein [Pseudomonadales bacterium]|nr:alpha-hydroxy-acid oxidizing protein [Pseudomonadales bacterium]